VGDARRRLALGLLLAGVLSATVALLAQASGILDATEQRAVSARFAIRGASVPADIVVVAIDDATFDRLGQQWPFPRSMHGRLIEVLHAAGAREIVYDVQFTEPTSEREDNALFAALQRTRGAVLATSVSDDRGRTSVLGGDENVRAARSVAAAANLPAGHGGVLDHVTYATGALKSLAVVTSARAGVPPPSSRAFGARGAWIDFRGPPGTITTIPFASVLRREVSPAAFRDKIVIVGASAPSLQDVHPTPTAAEPMAGAEIEANAIWTVMRGLPLRDAPAFYNVALLLLVAFTVPLLRIRLTVLSSALAGPAVVILVLAGAQVAFDQGSVTWVSAPVLAAVLSTVLMVIASHLSETAVRRRIARDNDTLELKVRERTQELRQAQLEILERSAAPPRPRRGHR
jgi:CHASE2 domain-containing sensor protein